MVDGATVLASIVPAECGPVSSISHIWYTVPGAGGGTLFITSTPASFSRENTTVAVPPDGMSPDTVRTSGAANTCSAVDGVAAGRIASPTPRAPSPITNAAAAASTVLRQRVARGRSSRTLSVVTVASTRSRRCAGGSTAVAADITAIVSRTARTSSAKARDTSAGAAASRRSMSASSDSGTACSAYGVAIAIRSGSIGSVMTAPGSCAARGWRRASAI